MLTRRPDTGHYWDLTKYIYRYAHAGEVGDVRGGHGVNEGVLICLVVLSFVPYQKCLAGIRGEAYLEMIRFLMRLILNADETDLLERVENAAA